MYLLISVINNEGIVDELMTCWFDIGITDSIIMESTDSLELVSQNIPIFAGFRNLTSGGMRHNKTILTLIQDEKALDRAVSCLEKLFRKTKKTNQGTYCVAPVIRFGRLGLKSD